MLLKIDLDSETASELVASAVRNLRTMDLEAYRLLREALSLPVPWPDKPQAGRQEEGEP